MPGSLAPFFAQTLTSVEGTDNSCMVKPGGLHKHSECFGTGSVEVNSSTPFSNQSCTESPTNSKLLGCTLCF